MAIKQKEDVVNRKPTPIGASPKKKPIVLSAEETDRLLANASAPPQPLSPELKRAIANYKRIKSECLE